MDRKEELILSRIRKNSNLLDACPRHEFTGEKMPPGNKYTCLICGGEMKGRDVLFYIQGYQAAGGDCNDIYPGWNG